MSERGAEERQLLSIGEIAQRTGLAPSAIRFYEARGLLSPTRSPGQHRQYRRSDLRRVSFVITAQKLGFSLGRIQELLASLPGSRTPTKRDWDRIARSFDAELYERIAGLQALRTRLSSCIGCGCLSLRSCAIHNPGDTASDMGDGPRYLVGDEPPDEP